MAEVRCKSCNCLCHCSVVGHSDMLGICPCQMCKCKNKEDKNNVSIVKEKVFGGVTVVDEAGECESCQ